MMRKAESHLLLLSVVLLLFVPIAGATQQEKQTITITSNNAKIYVEPHFNASILENIAVEIGNVFEVVGKTGEWYEIYIPSRFITGLTGFIYEKFVSSPTDAKKQNICRVTPLFKVALSFNGGYGYVTAKTWNSQFNNGFNVSSSLRFGITENWYLGYRICRQFLEEPSDTTFFYLQDSEIEGNQIALLDAYFLEHDLFIGTALSLNKNRIQFLYVETGIGFLKTYSKARRLIENQYETRDWTETRTSDYAPSCYMGYGAVFSAGKRIGILIGGDIRLVFERDNTIYTENGFIVGFHAGIIILTGGKCDETR